MKALITSEDKALGFIRLDEKESPVIIGNYDANLLYDFFRAGDRISEIFSHTYSDERSAILQVAYVKNDKGEAALLIRPAKMPGEAWVALAPRTPIEEGKP